MIVPMTLFLLMGQVFPVILLGAGLCSWPAPWPAWELLTALAAVACSYYPRLAAARRFHLPLSGAILHPLGTLVLLAIQWFAFTLNALGRPSRWKGRAYQTPGRAAAPFAEREIKVSA